MFVGEVALPKEDVKGYGEERYVTFRFEVSDKTAPIKCSPAVILLYTTLCSGCFSPKTTFSTT